jgi:hypothetical protein
MELGLGGPYRDVKRLSRVHQDDLHVGSTLLVYELTAGVGFKIKDKHHLADTR